MKNSREEDKKNREENSENLENKAKKEENTEKNKNENNGNKQEDKKSKTEDKSNELREKLKKEKTEDIIEKYIELGKNIQDKDKEIEKLKADINEITDKYKRALAEMENLRKRTVLEKQESLKYANFNIIADFLTILDDFQRAIDSAKSDNELDIKNFLSGIEMIEKQFIELLFKKYGTKRFGEKGDKFDPQLHQALMMVEGDFQEEVVIEVFRNGYMLHDRVVRHAQVKVGKPKNN